MSFLWKKWNDLKDGQAIIIATRKPKIPLTKSAACHANSCFGALAASKQIARVTPAKNRRAMPRDLLGTVDSSTIETSY